MNFLQSINIPSYRLQEFIGKGATSFVFKGINDLTNLPVAIKSVSKSQLTSRQKRTQMTREISFLKLLHHPLVAEFYETIEDEKNIYIIMEFLENGSLTDLIKKKGNIPENIAQKYFAEIFASIEYLHDEIRISHRDLKPQNIMLDRNNNIRLIDFGLSNQFGRKKDTFKTKCGTPCCCAPEILLGKPYTKSVDFWSLGIILYQMLTGVFPFQGKSIEEIIQNQSKKIFFPSYLSQNAISLLKGLLSYDPNERFSIHDIKKHIWFSNNDYSLICETFKQFKNTGIQHEIINKLNEQNIDTNLMILALKENFFSTRTCCYKQLARELEIKKMFEAKQKMESRSQPTLQLITKSVYPKRKRNSTVSTPNLQFNFLQADISNLMISKSRSIIVIKRKK
jgi:serine/threonine protein kinase